VNEGEPGSAAAALALGEGVRGMRPPAVLEEKMLAWFLTGVDTAAVAIFDQFQCLAKGKETGDEMSLFCPPTADDSSTGRWTAIYISVGTWTVARKSIQAV
jgi:hypothetical protein